jgi:leucyl aminopeptidase
MRSPRFNAATDVPTDVDVLGVPVYADLTTPAGAGAEVNSAFLAQRRFEGKPGQAQALLADDGTTIVALGVGEARSVDSDAIRKAGAAFARHAGSASKAATTLATASRNPELAAAAVEGIGLGSYRYESAPKRVSGNGRVEQVTMVGARRAVVRRGQLTVDATWRARDWVNRPARDMTPAQFASSASEAASGTSVSVEVWDEGRIEDERLGALLGVAAGASVPPRVIRLSYEPPESTTTVALVGKGITFDSGGLSLKSAASMTWMKADMGGAAAVISSILAIAELEVPVRIVGWVAATENMPSGTAIHPGDVLTARNGTTIEVLNTDAEGRLILADTLSLAAEEEPDAIVDIATLTGGQRAALGDGVCAVLGTDDDLVRRVIAAGSKVGEPAWELPLVPQYRRQIDSEVADLKNVSSVPAAQTIIAGLFLKEFTAGRKWAHIDIAAPAWTESDDGINTRGATGWGTRTLIELMRSWP